MRPTKIGCRDNVPRGIKKTNFSLVIRSHSSTNRANLAKICPVDGEIIMVWQKSVKKRNRGRT